MKSKQRIIVFLLVLACVSVRGHEVRADSGGGGVIAVIGVDDIIGIAAEVIEWIWEGVLEGMKRFFCWLMNKILDAYIPALEAMIGKIPADWQNNVSAFSGWFGTARQWVPIDLALVLFAGLMAVRLHIIVVQLVWKALPFTG